MVTCAVQDSHDRHAFGTDAIEDQIIAMHPAAHVTGDLIADERKTMRRVTDGHCLDEQLARESRGAVGIVTGNPVADGGNVGTRAARDVNPHSAAFGQLRYRISISDMTSSIG